jgi:hypothetical protein
MPKSLESPRREMVGGWAKGESAAAIRIGRNAFKTQYSPLLSTISILEKAIKLSDEAKTDLGWNKDDLSDVTWASKYHETQNQKTSRQKREASVLKREEAKSVVAQPQRKKKKK